MKIRLEQEKDFFEVENLTREAFWNVYHPGCTEHFIVHKIRSEKCFVPELDYIIEDAGKIIAQITYAKGTLTHKDGKISEMLLLGPVSVHPSHQKKGYGEKLIRFTLKQAHQLGYPAVVLTGSPAYYARFGFESASKHGVFYAGMDPREEFPFFMVKILDAQKAKYLKGTYSDPTCYFPSENEVEIFDRLFPPKIKEKKPGQLE